jgi:Rps23 Pro-64 3,4-dihydroxylase Tpa1-like proline 4-hydroxylase
MREAPRRSDTTIFPHEKWENRGGTLSRSYRLNSPFNHLHFSDFIDPSIAAQIASCFPGPNDVTWTQYKHYNQKKLGTADRSAFPALIEKLIIELQSEHFLAWLRDLTGIPNLIADPTLEGGGMHQVEAGGYLNIHADFGWHCRAKNLKRRVNLLLYLNEGWKGEWAGNLELWDKKMERCVKTYSPLLNSAVIFNTDPNSFHGHPDPLMCPPGITRKSIALYYFTLEESSGRASMTDYRARPADGFRRRLLILLDQQLIRVYSFARRRLGLSDKWISLIIKKAYKR